MLIERHVRKARQYAQFRAYMVFRSDEEEGQYFRSQINIGYVYSMVGIEYMHPAETQFRMENRF